MSPLFTGVVNDKGPQSKKKKKATADIVADQHFQTKAQLRKEKKLEKKLAKRDGPPVNSWTSSTGVRLGTKRGAASKPDAKQTAQPLEHYVGKHEQKEGNPVGSRNLSDHNPVNNTRYQRYSNSVDSRYHQKKHHIVDTVHHQRKHNSVDTAQHQKASKPVKIKPSKSVRKARKKLKEQLGLSTGQHSNSSGHEKDPATKVAKNKKANERKKNRNNCIAKEIRDRPANDYTVEFMNRSQAIKSWNEAF